MTEPSEKSASVLLVEEDEVTTQIILASLRRGGYDPDHTDDGYEAIRRLHRNPPNLLILDINISRPNGVEFLRSIRSDAILRNVEVLGIIMPGEAELGLKAQQLGVDDFLEEPFDPEEIVDRVDALVARSAGAAVS